MHCVKKSVLVPYQSAQMFELVDDVQSYPKFLPWCAGATVLEILDNRKTARIDIDYHGVRAHFTTDNVNRPPEAIVITLNDGPFRHLHVARRCERPDPRRALCLIAGVGQRNGCKRCAAGLRQHAVRIADPLPGEPRGTFCGAGLRRCDDLTATANRRGQAPRLVRHEQQERAGRRFLERLQQRVRGGSIHPLGRIDDADLGPAAMARQLRPAGQRADFVDDDPFDRLHHVVGDVDRLDDAQVRMLAGARVSATGTLAARQARDARRFADECAGKHGVRQRR